MNWSDKIKEEINNSEIIIALITEAVFKSKYIPGEIKEAINKQKLVIPCVRNNVDLSKLSTLGLTKEQVIVFNDNPIKIKEYYEKRKKQNIIKIAISAIAVSILAIVLVAYFVEPHFDIEEKYVFGKSWGNLSTNNLEFSSPSGVALDSKDNLYVVDTGNDRIQKIQPDGNITSIGKYGFDLGEFYNPFGVALDSKDNLYVADTDNNRIQKIRQDGNITSIGKYGTALGEFYSPSGVAIDSKDNLYVADGFNQRIQQFILSQHLQLKFGK
jgi:DNA-binding beta-propeller fold protein YncE